MSAEINQNDIQSDSSTLSAIYEYWDTHTLGLQYITDNSIEVVAVDESL